MHNKFLKKSAIALSFGVIASVGLNIEAAKATKPTVEQCKAGLLFNKEAYSADKIKKYCPNPVIRNIQKNKDGFDCVLEAKCKGTAKCNVDKDCEANSHSENTPKCEKGICTTNNKFDYKHDLKGKTSFSIDSDQGSIYLDIFHH